MNNIQVKKPTKIFSNKIGLSFTKFFEAIGKCAVMLSDDKPISALKELMGLISGLKVSSTDTEAIAYLLIYKSIVNTFYLLFLELEEEDFTLERNTLLISEELKQFNIYVDNSIEEGEIIINNEFFEYPNRLNLLTPVFERFADLLKILKVKENKRIEILSKFHTRFIVELNKEWNNRPTLYGNLINKLNSPFKERLEIIDDWNRYYGKLRSEVKKNIFEEHFSLEDVYIPLRAETSKYVTESDGKKYKRYYIHWVREYLNDWLELNKDETNIKFLAGGPGSGKSSFAKMWASELTFRKSDVFVFFINLQWFNIKGQLLSSIDDYIDNLQNEIHLQKNPLRDEAINKLLIIFDGLDELSQQGEYAKKISGEFLSLLERENSIRNQNGSNIFFLITGREITIQFNQEKIGDRFEILTLLPYSIHKDLKTRYDNFSLASIDQRNSWWRNYGKLKGINYGNGMPSTLRKTLPEITSQPFLNYLVAWNINEGGLNIKSILSSNQIYENIITQVLDRKYENLLPHPSTKKLRKEVFFKVLQEIAIAAWKSGDARIAKYTDIKSRLQDSDLEDYFQIFSNNAGNDTLKLLTTFYFRQHSYIGGERKIEFTHKTFGEYLVSTYLVEKIIACFRGIELKVYSNREGIKKLLDLWFELSHENQLDESILNFLREQINIVSTSLPKSEFLEFLQSSFNVLFANGFYCNKQEAFSKQLYFSRNSEESFYLMVNAFAVAFDSTIAVQNDSIFSLGSWLHKINLQDGNDNRLLNKNLTKLKVDRQKVYNHNFHKANMQNSTFTGCNLSRCNLANSQLDNVQFISSIFIASNFNSSILRSASFTDCRLGASVFRYSNLIRTSFIRCDLQHSSFVFAKNIHSTVFQECNLSYCDFTMCDINYKQIESSTSIYKARGIKKEIIERVRSEKPELLWEKPAYNKV